MTLFRLTNIQDLNNPHVVGGFRIGSGGTFELYNTADEVTNYERLRAYWSGNNGIISAESGGTGTLRPIMLLGFDVVLRLLNAGGYIKFQNSAGTRLATMDSTGKLRVGDATAPTVSLEAANGLTVAAGNITLPNSGTLQFEAGYIRFHGTGISAENVDGTSLIFACQAGSVMAEVARLDSGAADGQQRLAHAKPVNLLGAAASEKTIATGVITITAGYHTVDTEGDAATDDLDTISGGRTGDLLVIVPANAARTVVAKHGTGNLNLAAGVDFTMDEDDDFLVLLFIGSTWQEISRSENHA